MVHLRVIVLGLLAAAWCSSGAAEGKGITACLNEAMKLTCAGGKKISMDDVGFAVGSKCTKGEPVPSDYKPPCVKPSYQKALKDHCNKETTCEFTITQAVVNMFSCRNEKMDVKYLYLVMNYTCV